MKLYFLRHATATNVAPTDADRELTAEGREEARVAGKALARLGIKPDLILTSPLVRARQTAELVAEQLDCRPPLKDCNELAGQATPTAWLRSLRQHAKATEIMLVGHMPSLAEYVAHLLGAPNADAFPLGKGSVLCLELDELRAGKAALRWFLRQKQLRAIAGR